MEKRLLEIEKSLLRIELILRNHLSHHEDEIKYFLQARLPIILAVFQLTGTAIIYYLLKK